MKKLVLILVVFIGLWGCSISTVNAQGVGINSLGNPPDPSAILDASSHTKGVLIARMTATERDSIVNPAQALQIYNTTTKCYETYEYGVWQTIWCAQCPNSPTKANAGPDQLNISALSTILAGNTPTTGTGLWTITSGSGGSITTPSSPSSTFTGTAGTSYVLDWTISNAPCPASSDQVTISFSNCTIGTSVGGGIVFYSGGGKCYVSTTSDQGTFNEWGCQGTLLSGANGTAIGTGAQNTLDIVAGCGTPNIAAKLCDNLILNGYSDWFLPSKDELNQMYIQRSAIGSFSTGNYWSSSQSDNNSAWLQDYSNGGQVSNGKFADSYVRCIRAF